MQTRKIKPRIRTFGTVRGRPKDLSWDEQIKKELENDAALIQCAQEFNMVGDPTRLKICYLLIRHKELSVSEIAGIIGVSVSAVSRTLSKLKQANVVSSRRDFRHVYYQLKETPFVQILKERLNT